MPAIFHSHSRFIQAPTSRVRPTLDALWSGVAGDAFPFEHIRPWRHVPEGGAGFSLGTRFGHGPYRFMIDQCDEKVIRATIENQGYVGFHGFELVDEGNGTRITHTLRAEVATAQWIVWRSLVGTVHDWAVRSCLARIEQFSLSGGEGSVMAQGPESVPADLERWLPRDIWPSLSAELAVGTPPWQLQAFIQARRLTRRAQARRHPKVYLAA